MTIVESFWIPVSGGRRLHGRMWLPADAEIRPVPAILHYHPYPLDWFTRGRDDRQLRPLAERGFACLRVDMAGSGASEGLLHGEYLETEIADGVEILAWTAAQPWCNGRTGVMGSSWSGCNALQIAARQPPSLRAIISCDSTDDHYIDDVHYMGGCVSGLEMLNWGMWCHAFSVGAPDPLYVGDAWSDIWKERLIGVEPAVAAWLAHQRRDEFWRNTAVAEDPSAIQCPVLMIGGWGDGYRSAIFRMLEALPQTLWALIGPWCHGWPSGARPGPNLDGTAVMARWWRHWLDGQGEGWEREPRLVCFVEDSRRPRENLQCRSGRWYAVDRQLPDRAASMILEGQDCSAGGGETTIRWHHEAGAAAPLWCAYGSDADQPGDQRADDALALCLDWEVREPVTILGTPTLSLVLAADAERALVAARLCDVAPDGSSTLITDGQLNLAHREDHARLREMPLDTFVDVTFTLRAAGYCVPAGHRLRLALSPGSWPMAWPSPKPVSLRVDVDATKLALPLLGTAPPANAISVPALDTGAASVSTVEAPEISASERDRTVARSFSDGSVTMRAKQLDERRFADGLTASEGATAEWASFTDKPLDTRASASVSMERRRGDWQARIEVNGSIRADDTAFYLSMTLRATTCDETLHETESNWTIPRDLG